MLDALMILSGFALLAAGGEIMVRGAVATAESCRISPFVVAAVVVGFGSSMPELVTSIKAGLAGSEGIALGNIIGSNIANILIVLGLAALISPLPLAQAHARFDAAFVVVISAGFVVVTLMMPLTQSLGMVMLTCLAVYLTIAVWREAGVPASASLLGGNTLTGAGAPALSLSVTSAPRDLPAALPSLVLMLVALAILLAGGHFVVDGAISLAAAAGVSQTVIGLTIVAVGTTLPEIVTSMVAAFRGQHEVAVGNVLGSCLFNLLAIGGVIAILTPVVVPSEIARFDNLVMLATAAAFAALVYFTPKLSRLHGAFFLVGYAAYLTVLWP